jgi:hypothetical protein
VPVSAVPAKLDRASQEAVRQGQDPRKLEGSAPAHQQPHRRGSEARRRERRPRPEADRGPARAHAAPAGGPERFFQFLNRPFRFAVLAQPKWLTGNFIEPFFVRLPTRGSGIFLPGLLADFHSFKRGLKGFDPKLADELRRSISAACSSATGRDEPPDADDLPGLGGHLQVIAKLPVVSRSRGSPSTPRRSSARASSRSTASSSARSRRRSSATSSASRRRSSPARG